MNQIEEIQSAEYLFRVSPETVYEWLKAWRQRTLEFCFVFGNQIPIEIERKLLTRNNEIIDLALAGWGTNSETISAIYQKWCSRSAVTDWPPQPSTFSYAVLASILTNVNVATVSTLLPTSIPADDLDWLIEHANDDLFRKMHYNIVLGFRLLKRCSEKDGIYGRIDDDRWLFALGALGYNEGLHRINESNSDGADISHYAIHEAFVQAATISPKNGFAAATVGRLFAELPSAATDGACVSDKELAAAVQAWNVEIIDDEESGWSHLKIYHELDALTPSERVQFHLLRHYRSYFSLDPDDPVRVYRLAAYSKNPVNGGEGWGKKCTGKGLDIENFQRYAELDGPAFMYANSFNEYIWGDKEVSKFIKNFPCPKDEDLIRFNRKKCIDEVAKKLLAENDSSKESDSMEAKILTSIGEVRQELAQAQSFLNAQIGNLKKWLIWGGIIVAALVLTVN